MTERLQQHRTRRVHAERLLLEVDAPVAQVSHRPGGARQVLRIADAEPVMADDRQQHALRQRAAGVTDRRQCFLCGRLDLGEVVAPLAHHQPQVRVRGPGFLRCRGRLGTLPAQLGVQREHVLKDVVRHLGAHPDRRQPEIGKQRIALRLGQRYLQLRPVARRLLAHQLVGRHR